MHRVVALLTEISDFFQQGIKALVAIRTRGIVQFRQLKEKIPSWMDLTEIERMQSLSALWQLSKKVTTYLHFSMADGVQPVQQQKRLSINMEKATTAKMTGKEVLGQTMFTSFKVNI